MRQEACITSIDGLKRWFELNQKGKDGTQPYFTVWRGNEPRQDRLIYRNTEISDPDNAWSSLEEIIELHSEHGGMFRVYITTKPAFNVGMSTILKLPNANPYVNNNQGIGNMYGGGMYGSIRELVDAEVSKELKVANLQREIEDMKAEKDSAVSMEHQLLMEFLPVLKNLAQHMGMKMMGYAPSQQTEPAPGIHGSDPEPQMEGYDYDRIEPALDELREVVPDIEGALENLARMAKKNPMMAQQFIQSLAQQ